MVKKWKGINWREWADEYDSHLPSEREEIYNLKEIVFPHKSHFNVPSVKEFFKNIKGESRVVEFGGGKGRLACHILKENFPIVCWDNYDISSVVIENTICKHKNYNPIHLKDFPQNLDVYDKYNVCVMSDFIEHIKADELEELFSKLRNVKFYYIKSPIQKETVNVDWSNYPGTHILEIGWDDVAKILKELKFKELISIKTFKRK